MLPPTVTIRVLDAVIEAESVPAVGSWIINQISNAKEYKGRWGEVRAGPGSASDSGVPL